MGCLGLGEPVHRPVEPIADLGQRRRRRDRHLKLPLHVADQSRGVLQLRLVHVQEHSVDEFHLERNVLGEDIGHGARYRHDGLRSGIRRPTGQPLPQGSHIPAPAPPSRVILPDRSPHNIS